MGIVTLCMKCKNEIEDPSKACKCGCRSFVTGDLVVNEKGEIQCMCGNQTMERNMHADAKTFFLNSGYCTYCGKPIDIKTLRDKESMRYWE
ncbi:MAG: hypothetical protein QXJ06_04455 [Candidatus Aenigmatarchaeota archaeon]